MKKDNFYLNRIFTSYYPFILSGGTILYIFLAMQQKKGQQHISYSMTELELKLNMSHTSIRKYELILIMMGLLKIEIEHYHMYTIDGYQIKKKHYTLYQPLAPKDFERAISAYQIPNLENVKNLLPEKETIRYKQFQNIYAELCKTIQKQNIQRDPQVTYKSPITYKVFKNYHQGEDIYSLQCLFNIYGFLPSKVIVFYIYILRFWLQSEWITMGVHIPRKQIKKELGYGDEQIREAMYQLCAVNLLDLQKEKYYRYFLIPPVSDLTQIELRPFSAMAFLLPKVNHLKGKYNELYDNLSQELKR